MAARNAFECEACVEEEIPDLVIMDVGMSEKGWVQASQVLSAHPETKRVPIILHSDQLDERIRPLMEEVGATAFLRKPCLPDTLLEYAEILLSSSISAKRRKFV